MHNLEASSLPNFLLERIANSPALRAALYHVSKRSQASQLLSENDLDRALIDIWPTLGKDAIGLYSARGVFGAVGCTTAGDASSGNQSLTRLIFDRLSSLIEVHNLGQFGDAVELGERSQEVFDTLTAQFVGCWVQLNGYSRTKKELFKPIFESSPITLPTSKDSKTLLQEILQGRKLKSVNYQHVSSEGKENSKIFTVHAEALSGLQAIGSGRSKKDAEKEAARVFLATHLSTVRYPPGLQLRPDFDVHKAALIIPKIPTGSAVSLLAEQLGLPLWARNLFSLAFVHRSYTLHGVNGPFGNNNTLLAFLGSNVIQWAIPNVMLHSLNPSELTSRGGIAPLRGKVGSEEAMAIVANNLFSRGFSLLHGPGQEHVQTIPSCQVETLQAVIGAFFLYRETTINTFVDVFSGIDFLLNPIRKAIAELPEDRNEAMPFKTRLQERCQAIRINILYESKVKDEKSIIAITPTLRLTSPHNAGSLQLSLKTRIVQKHFAGKKIEYEGKLAEIILTTFDRVLGSDENSVIPGMGTATIARWILSHAIKEVDRAYIQGDNNAIARIAALEIFGIKNLKNRNFSNFESWYIFAMKVLEFEVFPEATLQAIYSKSANTAMQAGHARLIGQLPRIESFIRSLDPLKQAVGLHKSHEYQEVVGTATAFRLLSGEVVESTIEDLLSQAQLLYRTCTFTQSEITTKSIRYLEISGSLLLLVDTLFNLPKSPSARLEIHIISNHSMLNFVVKKPEGSVEFLKPGLDGNPLWEMLCTLLPILEVREDTESITVVTQNSITSNSRKFALKAWWSFHLRQPFEIVANDTIASLLHDLKNELLAYSTAANRASAATSQRSKYQLATDASRHCDEALEKILVLKKLLQSSSSIKYGPIPISMFFRNLTTEFLSWLPERISLSLSIEASNDEIWTDEAKLRSILSNLVRNAAKAMNDEGQLSIVYVYDRIANILEVEICDKGPGLTEAQFESLKSGKSISSTSRHGPGIGLLTVLLLTNELRGSVGFSNQPLGGLVVSLSFPSMADDAADEGENYVMNEIEESVVIDENLMGR
jgi:dsRNA-specific ribonuclease